MTMRTLASLGCILNEQPLKLAITAKQEHSYVVVQFREEREIREVTKKHLHHFTTSPPNSGLLCHEITQIVQQQSENRHLCD